MDDLTSRLEAARLREEHGETFDGLGFQGLDEGQTAAVKRIFINGGGVLDKKFLETLGAIGGSFNNPTSSSAPTSRRVDLNDSEGVIQKLTDKFNDPNQELTSVEENLLKNAQKRADETESRFKAVRNSAATLDSIINNPDLAFATGEIASFVPDVLVSLGGNALGSPQAGDARSDINRLNSQEFLRGFEALKGGGHISNAEGEFAVKAFNALATGSNLSDKAFKERAIKFRDLLRKSAERERLGVRHDSRAGKFYRFTEQGKRIFVDDEGEPLDNQKGADDIPTIPIGLDRAAAGKWIKENHPNGGAFFWNGQVVNIQKKF